MTTGNLLWGMTWRGIIWGALCGGILGIVFAILGLGVIYLPYVMNALRYADPKYLFYVLTDALFLGTPALPVGFILGVPVGAIAGTLIGCIIAIFTRIFFYRTEDQTSYRIAIRVVSGATAIIVTILMLAITLIRYQLAAVVNDALSTGLVLLIVVPALILVQKPTIGWYIDEISKAKDFKKKQELQSRLFS